MRTSSDVSFAPSRPYASAARYTIVRATSVSIAMSASLNWIAWARDRLAKRSSLPRVREGRVKACLADADGKRRDRDSAARERVQELPVAAAPRAQQVF